MNSPTRALKPRISLRTAGAAAMLATAVIFIALTAPAAKAQTYTIFYGFGGSIGAGPIGNLLIDGAGNLYGVTNYGGPSKNGNVYRLNSDGSAIRTHNFTGGTDGGEPQTAVIRDGAGNLYGTGMRGGTFGGICGNVVGVGGCGVVYRLDPSGKETVLYSFTGGADGWEPISALVRDSGGNLYGTTEAGGVFSGKCGLIGCGVVFKIDSSGQETVLHAFAGQPDGKYPDNGSLIRDARGNLYGVTNYGGRTNPACPGNQGCGLIFKVDTAGNYKALYAFTGGFDGALPGGLVRDGQGNLYGVTGTGGDFNRGTLFKLDPTGVETVLYSFAHVASRLTQDGAGNFYGITSDSVFKLDTSFNYTTLHTFVGGTDGSDPLGGVLVDAAGNLYGTTYFGGRANCGSSGSGCGLVYKITP